jgi:hypothetical protein
METGLIDSFRRFKPSPHRTTFSPRVDCGEWRRTPVRRYEGNGDSDRRSLAARRSMVRLLTPLRMATEGRLSAATILRPVLEPRASPLFPLRPPV